MESKKNYELRAWGNGNISYIILVENLIIVLSSAVRQVPFDRMFALVTCGKMQLMSFKSSFESDYWLLKVHVIKVVTNWRTDACNKKNQQWVSGYQQRQLSGFNQILESESSMVGVRFINLFFFCIDCEVILICYLITNQKE